MHLKRWLGIAVVLIIILMLLAYGFRRQPVLVETAVVSRGPLQVTIQEEGKTRVTDRYVVSAPVSGVARRVMLEVGDPVKNGQILLQLEPLRPAVLHPRSRAEAQARIAAAEANLNAAEQRARATAAEAGYWEEQLARIEKLFKTGDVPAERYDHAKAEALRSTAALGSARHAVEAAESGLESARATLRFSAASPSAAPKERVAIRSPVSGRVLKVIHKSEGVVNSGDPCSSWGMPGRWRWKWRCCLPTRSALRRARAFCLNVGEVTHRSKPGSGWWNLQLSRRSLPWESKSSVCS